MPTGGLYTTANVGVVGVENIGIGVDSTSVPRLGIVKQTGFSPRIIGDNVTPIQFGFSNQTGVLTNIGGATITERMRITTAGNVGIGTASPTYLLQLATDSAAKPTTNTWTISSDKRIKENIVDADIDICYNNIINIPLKRYGYNQHIEQYKLGNISDVNVVGFLADDFMQYYPRAINEFEAEFDVDLEYTIPTGCTGMTVVDDPSSTSTKKLKVEGFKGLNTSQLVPALVGAVKKQKQIIDNMNIEMTTLRQHLQELKAIVTSLINK
jgi:hypothetical protein